jgi:hypothetical protein
VLAAQGADRYAASCLKICDFLRVRRIARRAMVAPNVWELARQRISGLTVTDVLL